MHALTFQLLNSLFKAAWTIAISWRASSSVISRVAISASYEEAAAALLSAASCPEFEISSQVRGLPARAR
jgi:hypothetical protein